MLSLSVFNPEGVRFQVDAVVDTGSTAEFSLPRGVIDVLNLIRADEEDATLADGQVIKCQTFEAEILWQTVVRRVQVIELEMTPLIGMKLLSGHRLTVQCHPGGKVLVEEEQQSA
jgi:clan AA aspartic protease